MRAEHWNTLAPEERAKTLDDICTNADAHQKNSNKSEAVRAVLDNYMRFFQRLEINRDLPESFSIFGITQIGWNRMDINQRLKFCHITMKNHFGWRDISSHTSGPPDHCLVGKGYFKQQYERGLLFVESLYLQPMIGVTENED